MLFIDILYMLTPSFFVLQCFSQPLDHLELTVHYIILMVDAVSFSLLLHLSLGVLKGKFETLVSKFETETYSMHPRLYF